MTTQRSEIIARKRLVPKVSKIDDALGQYTTRPDTISPQMKEGLLDMWWQLGDDGLFPHVVDGVQKGYPALFRAIAEGDKEKIEEESKVTFKTKSGGRKYDQRRHQMRLTDYFNYSLRE